MAPKPLFNSSSGGSSGSRVPVVLGVVAIAAAGAGYYLFGRSTAMPPPAPAVGAAPKPRAPKDVPVPGKTKPVAAGKLHMGGPGGDPDELPAKDVDVAAFEIDETEVTVAAYAACVAAGKCTPADKNGPCNFGRADRLDHPINCVDQGQAIAYCKFVDERLPREEEWEYAAHGSDDRTYPWKDGPPGGQLCWNGEGNDEGKDHRAGTCPVGDYPAGASPFGALDMAGNVWEWVDAPYCPYDKPGCASEERVIRGGAWNNLVPAFVRARDRSKELHTARNGNVGFRCAK
ncbi:MAG TPA: SUMF1/EgtB/PvdO family nonheme iron enzyme [Polyangia bacterium]|jgi:formylglycine-generating enzyme required for sulfatase activity|nr:SUMF1/EgtB/PvdO family nonheme iron enzyme [Polyangia bacterium]